MLGKYKLHVYVVVYYESTGRAFMYVSQVV
jgi:hypothetical protein